MRCEAEAGCFPLWGICFFILANPFSHKHHLLQLPLLLIPLLGSPPPVLREFKQLLSISSLSLRALFWTSLFSLWAPSGGTHLSLPAAFTVSPQKLFTSICSVLELLASQTAGPRSPREWWHEPCCSVCRWQWGAPFSNWLSSPPWSWTYWNLSMA